MHTTVYGEDGGLLWHGAPLRVSEPKAQMSHQCDISDWVILTSGFALRDDDQWKRAMQLDLADCHRCSVASLPRGSE